MTEALIILAGLFITICILAACKSKHHEACKPEDDLQGWPMSETFSGDDRSLKTLPLERKSCACRPQPWYDDEV